MLQVSVSSDSFISQVEVKAAGPRARADVCSGPLSPAGTRKVRSESGVVLVQKCPFLDHFPRGLRVRRSTRAPKRFWPTSRLWAQRTVLVPGGWWRWLDCVQRTETSHLNIVCFLMSNIRGWGWNSVVVCLLTCESRSSVFRISHLKSGSLNPAKLGILKP